MPVYYKTYAMRTRKFEFRKHFLIRKSEKFSIAVCFNEKKFISCLNFHQVKRAQNHFLLKMFRQTSKLSIVLRSVHLRGFSSSYRPEPPCKHHKDLVPPFKEVGKLKSFELKSDCTTFHLKSEGYNPNCPEPCPPPCPEKKKPCPCPDEPPCN